MNFSFELVVDPANELLIVDVVGKVSLVVDVEHMLKNVIKMAGKHQVKNVVLDVTKFYTECSNVEIAKLMIDLQSQGLLEGVKIARIVCPENNVHTIIEGMADSLDLSIKNFESRSQAMLWLLFDKVD
ncbi:hypothetical protein [Paraglaciecola aestuariivivens]